MELESEDGDKIPIECGSDVQIGRELGLGFGPSSTDRSVSRRHLSLRLINDPIEKFRVGFEVIGKNPIWVCAGNGGDRRIFKKSEKGELRVGERLSLSLKKPAVFVVKRKEGENEEDGERKRLFDAIDRREKRTLERRREKEEKAKEEDFEFGDDDGIGSVDVSQIDPVKEFGFLVKGHEFDRYSKKKIAGIKSWNWFLEETSDVTDDDENIDEATSSKGKKGRGIQKKKHGADDDEEWTGQSEEENVVVVKGGSAKRPKYSTRSKDPKRPRNDASGVRNPASKKGAKVSKDEVQEEDEEDVTLGGFIVDEDEEEEAEDEESEEDFDDEEEDEEE